MDLTQMYMLLFIVNIHVYMYLRATSVVIHSPYISQDKQRFNGQS